MIYAKVRESGETSVVPKGDCTKEELEQGVVDKSHEYEGCMERF